MLGGGTRVLLGHVRGAAELRVFTVVVFCAAYNGGGAVVSHG